MTTGRTKTWMLGVLAALMASAEGRAWAGDPGDAPAAKTSTAAEAMAAPPPSTSTDVSSASSGAPAGEASDSSNDEDLGGDDAAAALGAANPVVASNTGKPWTLMLNGSYGVGSSAFVALEEANGGRAGDFSVDNAADGRFFSFYSVALTGLYRIAPLGEGRLDVFARTSFDQVVTDGYRDGIGVTTAQAFFWRDTRLGLLGRGLYKWKDLGVVFGANTSIDIPTSDQARFIGRIFRWNASVNASDMIPNVGPGSLLVSLFASFRKDVGEINPTVDPNTDSSASRGVCRSSNQDDLGNCLSDIATLNFGFTYGLSARYFLGPFSIGLGVTIFDLFFHDLGDSECEGALAGGINCSEIGTSSFALDAPPHSVLMASNIGATYVFNPMFNMSLSLSSFQAPFRYQDGNPRGLVFPFFDSPENNNTTVNLGLAVMY
ncbi:MAG: hypothetical protein AAFU79_09640 [Myxococcota bacterium]